jgi:hypothetical protein
MFRIQPLPIKTVYPNRAANVWADLFSGGRFSLLMAFFMEDFAFAPVMTSIFEEKSIQNIMDLQPCFEDCE